MNKKLLCTSVGGALALGSSAIQATSTTTTPDALIPYVIKDTNRTTVVTAILGNQSAPASSGAKMHLQYWTKSTTDANTAACKPSSVTVPVTPNDIVTFDTAGIVGYPLFGDTTNPAPLGMGIAYAGPVHGYLIIQSPYSVNSINGDSNGIFMQNAYWLEIDLANGGAHGDVAVLSPTTEGNFASLVISGAFLLQHNPSANAWGRAVNFFPSSVASTVFTVTPTGTQMVTRENNVSVLQVFNHSIPVVQGAYDRNENGVDGTVPITVRCVGRVTPAQLMPGVTANSAWAAQGGWGILTNLGNKGDTAISTWSSDAMVYQIDTSTAGGKFVDQATRISTDEY